MTTEPNLSKVRIVDLEPVAREFLQDVLGLFYEECVLSDEMTLVDLVGTGCWPDDEETDPHSEEAHALWDAWVLGEIDRHYKVSLPTTHILLVDLFVQLPAYVRSH